VAQLKLNGEAITPKALGNRGCETDHAEKYGKNTGHAGGAKR